MTARWWRLLAVGAILTCLAAPAAAQAPSSWDGVWSDGQGGVRYLESRGRFVTSQGGDAATVFTAAYLATGTTAEGHGDGVNHALGQRFLYWSKLTLQADGSLVEEWRVAFPDAPAREGRSTFRRPAR